MRDFALITIRDGRALLYGRDPEPLELDPTRLEPGQIEFLEGDER